MDTTTSGSEQTAPVDALATAVDQLAALVEQVGPDQTTAPTPCASWDVAALLDHLVADLTHFRTAARGEQVDWGTTLPSVAPHWAREFRQGGDDLVTAFRRASDGADGAIEPTVPVDMPTAEFAVHAWDLASALGAEHALDPVPAERGLAMMQGMLQPEMRGSEADGKAFGPQQPVAHDATPVERLAAFAGRDPRWSPEGRSAG